MEIDNSIPKYKIQEFLSLLNAKDDSPKLKICFMSNFLNANKTECVKFLNSIYFNRKNLPEYAVDQTEITSLPVVDTSMKSLSDFIAKPTMENYKTLLRFAGPFDFVLNDVIYKRKYNDSENVILQCIEEIYCLKLDLVKKYLTENFQSDFIYGNVNLQLLYYLLNPQACFHKIPIISTIFHVSDLKINDFTDLWTVPISSSNIEYQLHVNGNDVKLFCLSVISDEYIQLERMQSIDISCIQFRNPLYSYVAKIDILKFQIVKIIDLFSIGFNPETVNNLLKESFHRRREHARRHIHMNSLIPYRKMHNKINNNNIHTNIWTFDDINNVDASYLICFDTSTCDFFQNASSKLITKPSSLKIFIVAVSGKCGSWNNFGILITLDAEPQTIIAHVKFINLSNKVATRVLFAKRMNIFDNKKKRDSLKNPCKLIQRTTQFLKEPIPAIACLQSGNFQHKSKCNFILTNIQLLSYS